MASVLALPWALRRIVASEKENIHELRVLSERPFCAEAPMHLLDDEVTPLHRMFVRNNGHAPSLSDSDIKNWRLKIDGEVEKPLSLSLHDLQHRFKVYSYQLVLECGGNGRAGFHPPTSGVQWTYGGVGCPLWTGVLLKDVLAEAKVKKSAVYLGYYGMDVHLSGDNKRPVISRGCPIEKALDDMTLIAFAMNGEALPAQHGFPARLVCPGFPASASGKWLQRLWVRDCVHDGPKMEAPTYRMPRYPAVPGGSINENEMDIIELMPVRSVITNPKSSENFAWRPGQKFTCRGFAWSGAGDVKEVHVSYDFGQTWVKADLKSPRNRFAWQRWEASFLLPKKGYYELWARATDVNGKMQPMVVPEWNPHGYLNNAMPRIAVNALA